MYPAAHSINSNETCHSRRLLCAPRGANSGSLLLRHPIPKHRCASNQQLISLFHPHARPVAAKLRRAALLSTGQRAVQRIEVCDGLAVCRDLIAPAPAVLDLADKSFDHNVHQLQTNSLVYRHLVEKLVPCRNHRQCRRSRIESHAARQL